MLYEDDPMLAELRQIKAELWERSGHDLHKMAQMMTKKARETISQYDKFEAKRLTESTPKAVYTRHQ